MHQPWCDLARATCDVDRFYSSGSWAVRHVVSRESPRQLEEEKRLAERKSDRAIQRKGRWCRTQPGVAPAVARDIHEPYLKKRRFEVPLRRA